MEFNEYQMAAERTARSETEERERFINFVFGLTGEAGERKEEKLSAFKHTRYLERILNRFNQQREKGISKYEQILEENPRDVILALEALAEELTDALMYAEEAIEKCKEV